MRYPRSLGSGSVVNKVQDLWIYSNAANKLCINVRSTTKLELIRRFLGKGYVTIGDVKAVDKLYPQEENHSGKVALCRHHETFITATQPTATSAAGVVAVERCPCSQRYPGLCGSGNLASPTTRDAGWSCFPDGNQAVGQRLPCACSLGTGFPSCWYAMSYATCGGNVSCIAALTPLLVKRQ